MNYSIIEECPHDIAETKVIKTVATCETTVTVCLQCGVELDEPETNC